MNALEIRDLNKRFPKFHLQDINISLPQGFAMGLVGRNGAGKTTLFKIIMNHLFNDSGSIQINGLHHRRDEALAKSQIAYVADAPAFSAELSLQTLKNAFATVYKTWDEQKFQTMVAKFQLNLRSNYKSLSKGMKTKFYLALSLCHDAQLLLLDEPTAGLDPVVRREVLDLLRQELQDEKKAVLISTHVTSDLEGIADYLTIIDNGRILMSESRETISDTWRLIKLDKIAPQISSDSSIEGQSKTAFGYSLLTSNYPAIRSLIPQDTVIERPNYEDIMIHMVKGDS
ncbi:ABC transporter ATP-binding protein [bacterium]|nr:ABC transporter ATP-binding protein [bacterium]